MKGTEISACIYHRARNDEDVQERHATIMKRLQPIGGPFGLAGVKPPAIRDFGTEVYVGYMSKHPDYKGVTLTGGYEYRSTDPRFAFKDKAGYDENMIYEFKTSYKLINYKKLIHRDFMRAIEAFGGYRAVWYFGYFSLAYEGGYRPTESSIDENGNDLRKNERYNRLRADPSLDVNGRNNIFTLHPAQYWDAELCRRALHYGPDEVIRRLLGKAIKVEPLGDGVYVLLNDDPEMSFDDYLELNRVYKDILGLY
jgi:hypothetical protein